MKYELTGREREALHQVSQLMQLVLSSSLFEDPTSWDTLKGKQAALQEQVGNFLQVSFVTRDSFKQGFQVSEEHIHMCWAIYCQMRAEESDSVYDLDVAKIVELYHRGQEILRS